MQAADLQNHFTPGNIHPSSAILVSAVFEWAKNLCFTSCGNYLCQQLLERADLADKQKFIEVIKWVLPQTLRLQIVLTSQVQFRRDRQRQVRYSCSL